MKKENIKKAKEAHGVFHKILLPFCVMWIVGGLTVKQIPDLQLAPVYLDAIETTDPLDFLDDNGLPIYATY